MHACVAGVCGVVELLVAAGANLDLINKESKTALDLSLQNPLGIDGDKMAAVVGVLAKHSLRAAAQVGDAELVAEHIAQGADLAARNGCGRTALVVACAHGHEKAAAHLVVPTHATGAINVVGGDGFSALLWAEERGLDGVAQSLRECGAAAVRRPALTLFRGEWGAVQVDIEERTVVFAGSFATVRSAQRCPLGGKGYYEIEILEIDNEAPQYGFAAPAFGRVIAESKTQSGEGVGDDEHSWAVDGARQLKWHVSGDADDTTNTVTNTARLSEAFGDLDRDGDGVLSLAEFTPLAKAVGADGADAVQEMFNDLDTHSNGVISESEFFAFFRHCLECDDLDGLGDDAQEGLYRLLHILHMIKDPYECTWQDGDVIGLACDLDKMQIHISLNGSFAAPHGVVFELAPDAVGEGLFAAFSGNRGKVRFNFAEADFRHAPPAADFQAYAAFEG